MRSRHFDVDNMYLGNAPERFLESRDLIGNRDLALQAI
jgi:hypothetical protein